MKSDSDIQKDVIEALRHDPSVTHEHIGVSCQDGIVTLSGTVPNYFEKSAAEKATQKVSGVEAVVENIEVKIPGIYMRDDKTIATAILDQFYWHVQIPQDKIKIAVEEGRVNLTGEVDWEFQRIAAENCVRSLTGVIGVNNNITLRSKNIKPEAIKAKIQDALKLEAIKQAKNIQVEVKGTKVILSGKVNSFTEMEDIKWATWGTPGVLSVENNIHIASN